MAKVALSTCLCNTKSSRWSTYRAEKVCVYTSTDATLSSQCPEYLILGRGRQAPTLTIVSASQPPSNSTHPLDKLSQPS